MRSMTVAGVLLALSSASALAAGWGSQTRISGYFVYEGGTAYLTTENNQNPDGCSNSQYLALDPGSANFKAIWAQVIAAHTAGMTVALNYAGCLGNYPRISAVAMPNVW